VSNFAQPRAGRRYTLASTVGWRETYSQKPQKFRRFAPEIPTMERRMKLKTFLPVLFFATLALPIMAQAQGTVQGAQEGAAAGDREAGPVGAVVGGAVGAVTGTIGGILGIGDRPRFHEYVVQQRHPSYPYSGELRVGAILPPDGPTYYDIPGEYHVRGYRYAYVNDHAVLVDPRSRQIVQIID
jgi:hypothetical protein